MEPRCLTREEFAAASTSLSLSDSPLHPDLQSGQPRCGGEGGVRKTELHLGWLVALSFFPLG